MKKSILVLMIIVLIISTIGCAQSDLENYRLAMDKTDNMSKGSITTDISMNSKINTVGIDAEGLKILKGFENTKFNLKGSFDKKLGKSKDELYIYMGGLGYDMNIYGVDGSVYLEPFFLSLEGKKYIEIGEDDLSPVEELPKDIFVAFGEKWADILKEENVMKGKKVLVTTEDGEVKSREFTVELNDEQLKELLIFFLDLLQEDDEYKEILNQMIYYSDDGENLTKEKKEELFNEIFNGIREFVLNAENMKLFYKAYIDIDGYVVQEDILFSLENKDSAPGEVDELTFEMTNQYYNIEKEQNLEFETPATDETIKYEDLNIESLLPQKGAN